MTWAAGLPTAGMRLEGATRSERPMDPEGSPAQAS